MVDDREELRRLIEQERQEKRDYHHNRRDRNKDNINKKISDRSRSRHEAVAARPKPTKCEVCGAGGKIVFDHCHTSDKFRGWICNRCNIVLRLLEDDADRLEKLAVYIRSHV